MSKQLILEIDETLYKTANEIAENIGLDIQTTVKMFLTKVTKEKSLSFLLTNNYIYQTYTPPLHSDENESNNIFINKDIPIKPDKGNMTKNKAIRLFMSKGINIDKNTSTFASKNRGAYNYWANVEFDILFKNWYLILNDWINKTLYLFVIPANSIKRSQLTPRNDKQYLIDLQIMYNDSTFTDNRSGVRFLNYLVDQIDY